MLQVRDAALEQGRLRTASLRRRDALARSGAVGVLVIVGVVPATIVVVTRRIVSPLVAMTGTVERIARRDHAVEIPNRHRSDEIGSMAAALDTLHRGALAAEQVAREREAERAHG